MASLMAFAVQHTHTDTISGTALCMHRECPTTAAAAATAATRQNSNNLNHHTGSGHEMASLMAFAVQYREEGLGCSMCDRGYSIWGTPIKMPHTATKSHWMLNSSELSECLGPTMAFHGTRNLHCNDENGSNMIIKCIPKEYADQLSPWVCFWRHGAAPGRLPRARG